MSTVVIEKSLVSFFGFYTLTVIPYTLFKSITNMGRRDLKIATIVLGLIYTFIQIS